MLCVTNKSKEETEKEEERKDDQVMGLGPFLGRLHAWVNFYVHAFSV